MSINATDLYEDGPAAGAKAKILLIHFDGAIDAGGACLLYTSDAADE